MSEADFLALAFSLGSAAAAERYRHPRSARVVGLSLVARAWKAYRRDAGAGDVGPEHQSATDTDAVQSTHDMRRDAVLLWLAEQGDRRIAPAAQTIAVMTSAKRRFGAASSALLDSALDALDVDEPRNHGTLATALGLSALGHDHPLTPLASVVGAIDRLSADPEFVEARGEDRELTMPAGTLRHFVPAEPAATWALNLALLARPPRGLPTLPGPIPRAAFRLDLDPGKRAQMLIRQWTAAADRVLRDQTTMSRRLERGEKALAGLSRNARAGAAWELVAGLGPITRFQIARALNLSRAGADIQARALASAGLVRLEGNGQVRPVASQRSPQMVIRLDDAPLAAATAALDESMAEIDRLLARTSADDATGPS